MRIRLTVLATLTALLPLAAAAVGSLDASFGVAGRANLPDPSPAPGYGELASKVLVVANGKLLVLGETADVGPTRVLLSRHNADGSLDTTFGSGGRATLDFGACSTCPVSSPSFAVGADGAIVVGATESVASISSTNKIRNIAVARLFASGVPDTLFGVGGVARVNPEGASILYSLAVQPDGKVLIAGSTGPSWLSIQAPPNPPLVAPARWLVTRLNAGGTTDATFTDRAFTLVDLAAPSIAQRVAVQSTGHIVVVGKSSTGLRGYRYDDSGTVTTFLSSADGDFSDLAIDSQNRPWALATGSNGSSLTRFAADLSGTGGWTSPALPTDLPFASVLPLPNGEAFVAGGQAFVAPGANGLSAGGTIVKLSASGSVDTSFGDGGRLAVDHMVVNGLARQSDGRVVGAGRLDGNTATSGVLMGLIRVDPASSTFVSREWLGFPIQSLGTSSGTQVVTVTNNTGSAKTVNVSASANYMVQGCAGSIAAGASCTVSIAHRPTTTTAAFSFMDYDASPVTITDSGGRSATLKMYSGVEKSLVQHYYRSILRRDADLGGWDFWNSEARRIRGGVESLSGAATTNTTEAWYAMAMAFLGSSEYAALNTTDDAFVTDLYRAFFDRAPDGAGLAYWRGQIQSGLPRDMILTAFMFSGEFSTFNATYFGGTANRPEIDLVMDMYRGLLGRLPDDAGLAFWVQRLQAAQCQGAAAVKTEASSLSSLFATGAEYASRGRSNAQYVADLYNAMLRRAGDAGGFSYWTGSLNSSALSREDARRAFLDSAEFSGRVAAVIAKGCKG